MKDEISKYLKKHETFIDQVSLSKRLFRDYKEQKAYSYFDSEFMFEAFYHPIVFESQYCFIKAKCTPSQRINDVPHDVWVLLNKFSGDIKSGYCTCFAGLGQSCNHVAALLFKINHAWETGLSQVSVTSKLSTWNRSKKVIESIKVKDMHVVKPKAERSIRMGDRVNTVTKRLFSVHNSEKGMTENEFLERLQEISPDSVTLGERKPQRHPVYCQYDQELCASPSLPPSVENLASMCQTVEELETKIFTWPFDECDAVEIESNTRNQGSEVWCAQRKGRVTASNFHRVHTRMQSYNRTCDIDMSACISDVLGYSQPNGELRALKYGRNMEDKACKEYEQYLKSKGHKNVNVQRCGLFVNVSSPYLGASPDRIISCDCCPKRVLEVKCPMTCMHESPSSSNVECLQEVNGEVKLKNSHKYFTQVQGQMAIANCDYADFFVFSPHGFHVETIRFNEQLWSNISTNLTTFFLSFVIPELVTRNVQKSMSMKPDVKHKVSRVPAQVKSKQKGKGRGKSTKRKAYHPVYTCWACKSRFKFKIDKCTTHKNNVIKIGKSLQLNLLGQKFKPFNALNCPFDMYSSIGDLFCFSDIRTNHLTVSLSRRWNHKLCTSSQKLFLHNKTTIC